MSVTKQRNATRSTAGGTKTEAGPEAPVTSGVSTDGLDAAGNVGKIRDILFGSQMREYEIRFARLEQTLLKESAQLRSDMNQRLDALEAYVKKELASAAGKTGAERTERSEAVQKLTRDVKSLGDSLTKSIEQLGDKASVAEKSLLKQLLSQSKELAVIQSRNDDLNGAVERQLAELRGGKVERSALADLMAEVARRLKDESRQPGTSK